MEIRKAGLEDLKEICSMGYQLSLDMSALEPKYFAIAEQREEPMREAILEEHKDIFLATLEDVYKRQTNGRPKIAQTGHLDRAYAFGRSIYAQGQEMEGDKCDV